MDRALDQVIDDDVLRLIFTACHPVPAVEGRVALTLGLTGGLTTAEIARAFLVPEKTMGQRIFRAKTSLSEAMRGTPRPGEEWTRAALCDEALRLVRTLVQLLPGESEVHDFWL